MTRRHSNETKALRRPFALHPSWRCAVLTAALLAAACAPALALPNRPFGSHPMTYASGTIRPNHVSQAVLDQAVRDFYDAWKARFIAPACGPGRYVVLTKVSGGNLTVSEGHGYGMVLAALMAGHDPQAKEIFDGMYAYFRDHPSGITPELMAWNQSRSCKDVQGADTASDGDLDIAFALLLADKQWGSCGAIDYLAAAQQTIAGIKAGELDPTGKYVKLGDWASPDSGSYYTSTRSSDFMPDHYRAFQDATGDATWTGLLDRTYQIVADLQASHSPATGLLPDFVLDPLGTPAPAGPFFLEGPNDGAYDYNACRDPWRLATDFVVNGESRAHTAVESIDGWIRSATAGDPTAIRSGYQLGGVPSPNSDYLSMAFVAPLGVGAMVDSSNQAWLNAMWDRIVATPITTDGYYENTLKMLAMIVISGNWWSPERVAAGSCDPGGTPLCQAGATIFGARIDFGGLAFPAGLQSLKFTGGLLFPEGRPGAFPLDGGAQLLIEDLGAGSSAVFDLTTATDPIPSSAAGVCSATKDGWKVTSKTVQYKNGSTALDPPTCTAGSANGLYKLQYKVSGVRDLGLQVLTRRSAIGPTIVGPVRATLLLGPTSAAGAAGACGLTPSLACAPKGAKLRCE